MDTASRQQTTHTVIVTRDGRFSCEDVRRLLEALARGRHGRPAMATTWTA